MKLVPLDNRVIILTAIIGISWLGAGKTIAQPQKNEDANIRPVEQPAKIAEKPKSPAELTITSENFPLAKGMKSTWAITGCDGNDREITTEVSDEIPLGDITIYKLAYIVNGKNEAMGYAKKHKDSLEYYPPAGGQLPGEIIRFPLVKGLAYEYQNSRGKVKVRVEGPEEVNTPAGRFTCLVLVNNMERDSNTVTRKNWIAPGFGSVKSTGQCDPRASQKEFVSALKTIQTDSPVSSFDFEPFVSTAFARSKWEAGKGDNNAISVCELDTTNGAAGTPFSLKWSYDAKGKDTWVNVGILLNKSWTEPVDLSKYDSISFYIKAAAEKDCAFKIQTGPWKEKRLSGAHIPLKLTSQWQKVVIDLKMRPELKDIDLTKTYTIELVDCCKKDISNVVWIDEIVLHKANDKIKSGIEMNKERKI
jgi:hypothetical protein